MVIQLSQAPLMFRNQGFRWYHIPLLSSCSGKRPVVEREGQGWSELTQFFCAGSDPLWLPLLRGRKGYHASHS